MAIPTDGLVFYAPLAEDKATAETGQTMNYTGNSIVFENYKGKNSFKLDGTASNYISATLGSLEGDFTISFFCIERERKTFAQLGYYGSYFAFYDGNIALADSSHNLQTDKGATVDTWYFYSISRSGNTYIFYRNYDILFYGEDSGGGFSFSGNLVLGKCFSYSGGWQEFFGNIAAFRIYSRALNISEIYSLANEFNEDSGGSDSGNTGFLIDGLFLSSSKPKLGQKGLLLDNKYFLPLVEGYGGSAEYYRCASVDTSAKTWTGYRAVLNEGVYTFEDTVTTGLSYTSVIPQVGSIYSSDALASVEALWDGIPTDGLVLYAPLNMSSICTKTGQTITETDISYAWDEILKGNAAVFNGSSARINLSTENIPSSGSPRTVSFWCCPSANSGAHIFNIGGQADRFLFFMENTGIFYLKAGSNEISSGVSAEIGKWYHICIKVDDSNSSLYINSSLAGSTGKPDNSNSNFYLGCGYNQESFFSGKMASLRIYNTALDSEKVELLYREHQISET